MSRESKMEAQVSFLQPSMIFPEEYIDEFPPLEVVVKNVYNVSKQATLHTTSDKYVLHQNF